uniref:Movement protein n=1 Tax=Donkey orchid symptomless virus TaxID=1400526 RepID=A0A0F7KH13_9VIRU|nr:movement protein [Donkey orchid symptomless virus]
MSREISASDLTSFLQTINTDDILASNRVRAWNASDTVVSAPLVPRGAWDRFTKDTLRRTFAGNDVSTHYSAVVLMLCPCIPRAVQGRVRISLMDYGLELIHQEVQYVNYEPSRGPAMVAFSPEHSIPVCDTAAGRVFHLKVENQIIGIKRGTSYLTCTAFWHTRLSTKAQCYRPVAGSLTYVSIGFRPEGHHSQLKQLKAYVQTVLETQTAPASTTTTPALVAIENNEVTIETAE